MQLPLKHEWHSFASTPLLSQVKLGGNWLYLGPLPSVSIRSRRLGGLPSGRSPPPPLGPSPPPPPSVQTIGGSVNGSGNGSGLQPQLPPAPSHNVEPGAQPWVLIVSSLIIAGR